MLLPISVKCNNADGIAEETKKKVLCFQITFKSVHYYSSAKSLKDWADFVGISGFMTQQKAIKQVQNLLSDF